jgi:uncharacterized protein YxjI
VFDASHYEVRQRVSLGNKYNIYENGSDDPVLRSAQKTFRLKEDFRFEDPETGEEVFRVKADSVLDISAAYDIVDSRTDERVGSVRRDAMSFLKHEYALLGPDGEVVARVREDSVPLAVARRLVTTLIPFSYDVTSPDGATVLGEVSGQFSLRDKYTVDLHSDEIDPRLVVIATVVIDAIEEN